MNPLTVSLLWKILDTGASSAEENMRIDADLLGEMANEERPCLHFYDWEHPSATFGLLTKPELYLDLEKVKKYGLTLVKRPTGGGIVFHLWDLAFSIVVPARCSLYSQNTLSNYALVNQGVVKAVETFMGGGIEASMTPEDHVPLDGYCKRFCMAQPTKYDVVWKGCKIAGAAQRQTKHGFLHQGTISLGTPDYQLLEQVLLPESKVLEAMKRNTFALLGFSATDKDYIEGRSRLKQLLTSYFTQL
jgi:lipoate---protein ligase